MMITATVAAGCTAPGAPVARSYDGYESLIIADDLVNFLVTMRGAERADEVTDYARCVAAQYALDRGNGFARHIRTNVSEEAGVWRADAVYSITPALPEGLRTIDTEIAVQHCALEGIPTT